MPAAPQTAPAIGWGGQIRLQNDATPRVYVKLDKVRGEIALPQSETDEIEVTNFDSPNRRREFIAGLEDAGEGTFELIYIANSATDILLRTAKAAGTVRKVQIDVPNELGIPAWRIETDCFVKNYGPTMPLDDVMMAEVTFRYSGGQTQVAI